MSDDLVRAAFEGDAEKVGRLLDAGADINRRGRIWNALHAAIENHNVACVQLLIRRGADVEYRAANLWPLAHAVDVAVDGTVQRGGRPGDEPTDIINLLLDAGADPDSGLEIALRYESSRVVDLLTSARDRRLT